MSKPLLIKKLLERVRHKRTAVDRLFLGLLLTGLALLVAFLAYLVWFMMNYQSVAFFLPADKTVAYLEVDNLSLPQPFKSGELFDPAAVGPIVQQAVGFDALSLVSRLARGRVGIAVMNEANGKTDTLLFLKPSSRRASLAQLKGLGLPNEELSVTGESNTAIYSFPQSQRFSFTFVGPYLFASTSPDALTTIQTVYQSKTGSLQDDADYQQSLARLPRQTWLRGYMNAQRIAAQPSAALGQIIEPLRYVVKNAALAVRKEQNGFHFNTLLSLNPGLLPDGPYRDPNPFAYSLADYLSSKTAAVYLGGANLSGEWENTLKAVSQLNPSYGIILEGILRAQASHLFGDSVDVRNDLYPLFEGEYALAMERLENGELGLKLILKHSDRNFAEAKLEKMLEGFRLPAARFTPTLHVFTLPDGTESRELVANPARLKEVKEDYKNYPIHCLEVIESVYGFCYTVTDDLIVISNHPDSLKSTIDLSISPRFTLSQSQPFRQTLSNLSAVSDEITFLDFKNLAGLTELPWLSHLADLFQATTWIKHSFTDGISTEGYVLFE